MLSSIMRPHQQQSSTPLFFPLRVLRIELKIGYNWNAAFFSPACHQVKGPYNQIKKAKRELLLRCVFFLFFFCLVLIPRYYVTCTIMISISFSTFFLPPSSSSSSLSSFWFEFSLMLGKSIPFPLLHLLRATQKSHQVKCNQNGKEKST